MNGLNRAFFIGRIGQDPELRSTATGQPVLRLSIGTPHATKVDGATVEDTDWHRVVAFGKDAEYLTKYAKKGDTIALECAVSQSRWTDKENKEHSETSFTVERVLWLFSKPKAAEASPGGAS